MVIMQSRPARTRGLKQILAGMEMAGRVSRPARTRGLKLGQEHLSGLAVRRVPRGRVD